MDYRILIEIMKTTNRALVSQTYDTIRDLFNTAKQESIQYAYDDEIDYKERLDYKHYTSIYNLANTLLEQKRFVGNANDFHNLSVEFANNNDQDYACRILEKGIMCFPTSVDLLADYLAYCNGVNTGMSDETREYAEKCRSSLSKIHIKKWNWRGFLFSITYLLEVYENSNQNYFSIAKTHYADSIDKEIEFLINAYKKYLPGDERAYVMEDRYLVITHDNAKEEMRKEILLPVIQGKTPVNRTTQVAFLLAKIYFDETKYSDTIDLLNSCMADINSDRPDYGINVIYNLLAFSRLSKYYYDYIETGLQADPNSSKEQEAKLIYRDFYSLSQIEPHNHQLLTLLKIFNLQTGISNDYEPEANVY